MLCPNEKSEMRQVKLDSHYGQTVILDQCPDCGGIWFDTMELYSVKQGQSAQIDHLDPAILQALSPLQALERFCPHDQARLARFVDPFFPKDLVIERCPDCGGLWLNRGEFTKYQQFRQTRLDRKESVPEAVPVGIPVDGKVESLGKLGQFLSIPMDPYTWKPLEPEKMSEKEQTALNTVLNAVSLILRFFIRI
jgi:uncharacterized protein